MTEWCDIPADSRAWYAALYPSLGPERRIEQRYLDRAPTFHCTRESAARRALAYPGTCNVYAGAALRDGSGHGRKVNCVVTRVLWLEYDGKHHGHDLVEPLARLQSFGLPLSLIVCTGGGFYACVLLDAPVDLTLPGVVRRIVVANQRLARAVGDGVTLDHVHDITRILRPPGTVNYKYTPARPVELVQLDQQRTYGLSEVEAWLDQHYPHTRPAERTESATPAGMGRPGDDFNDTGDPIAVLLDHGWHLADGGDDYDLGDEVRLVRPEKDRGTSAVWYGGLGVLIVYEEDNCEPFTVYRPNGNRRGYRPFEIFALLEHSGDFAAAAEALRAQGYGGQVYPPLEVPTGISYPAPPVPTGISYPTPPVPAGITYPAPPAPTGVSYPTPEAPV
jgi:hypothetical protein